ncbi:hypothetical protein ACJRPK_17485, partial [Aquimarina sp. 2-A2]|uniref:hypothetical protein n=1 Tax=Aquimarina sp. 2-A2 TaxID=3382644 RepID=UPI00387F0D54
TTDKILDGTIASADIAADAVNAATINGDVAGTGLVQNITTGALEVDPTAFNGDGNITSGDLTVGGDANALLGDVTLEIAAGAVGTAELADGAVTNIKLAANAVTTDKILDGTIATTDIASGGNDKVLTTSATGVVTWEDKTALDTDDQTAAQVAFTPTGNTTSTDVQAAIEEIQTEVDGFAAVAGQTNTASNVGTAGVGVFKQKTGADLEFKNINSTSGKITVTDDIANNEIDLEISANAITSTELADGAVTNIKLAANAVTTDKILDGTIASADIAADAVNAATINGDVAGTGLVQNITTGALEVDPTA